jgi:hypothetical protein
LEDHGQIGSAGAHFEKQIFGNELMVSDSPLNSVFSEMTLAVGIDSGWFDIDLAKAEYYEWGRNKTCKMIEMDLNEDSVDEFCANNQETKCSENHRFINKCQDTRYSEHNKLNQNEVSCYKKKKENDFSQFHHDHDSICMEMSVKNGKNSVDCFDIKCHDDRSKYDIFLKKGYGGFNDYFTFTCDQKNKKIPRYLRARFNFKCKDPYEICDGFTSCMNDCHNR